MPRQVDPQRVARLQRRFLRRQGASPEEIRHWRRFLTAQIGAESNFREGVGSPAGAQDIAQFMLATARSYGVRLGDNRIKDDLRGQIRYMLPLLRKYGVEGALRAYNAGPGAIEASKGYSETNAYVRRVLGSAGRYRGGDRKGARGGRGGASGGNPALPGGGGAAGVPQGSEGLLALLGQLGQKQAPVQSMGLQSPEFTAGPTLPQGYQSPVSAGGPGPKQDIAGLLSAIQTVGGDVGGGGGGGVSLPGVAGAGGGAGGGGGGGAGGRPRVKFAPGANRPGVGPTKLLTRALDHLSASSGHKLVVGTGSAHSQYTTSGNISDHWAGNGADIPLTGSRLTHRGHQALIAFGMSPKEARKAKGGIYNLTWRGHRVQVIFNTTDGGNHWNHLHIGIQK